MDFNAYLDRDRKHLWHPYTRFSALSEPDFPLMVRGEGPFLFDAEGRRYVDAISSWWAAGLGHRHPRIVEAIRDQADRLQHCILGNMSHPRAVELAAQLAALMPDPDRHVHFASDGACAVEAALKISLQYWFNRGEQRRHRLVSLNQGYHGDTLATVSLGYLEQFHRPFKPVLTPTLRLPVPPYDGDEAECMKALRQVFEAHGEEVAACVVEPLCQGAAGMRIYSTDFLQAVYETCASHGALFVVDEIATGFGRTGRMFAFEHAGIDPDIVCVGKALSAGYLPISATIVRNSIYETFRDRPEDHTFYHGHTFAGNPIAAAAALEALAVYREEDIVGMAQKAGRVLQQELEPLRAFSSVADVRCLGMIGAVELKDDVPHPPPLAQRVQAAMRDEGYLVRPLGNVVYLMLPLNTPEEAIRSTAGALRNVITRLE